MGLLPHIQLAEPLQPEGDELGADPGLGQLLTGDPGLQILLVGFQFFQPCLGGLGEDSLLDGVQQILDGPVYLPQLLFVQGKVHILPVLQIHQHRHDGFNDLIVHDHLHGLVDHQVFDPVLPHRFLVALRPLLFHRYALVVPMHLSRVADAALPAEVRSAVTAEQLGSQQKFFLGLITGRGLSVFGHPFLHPVKEFL